jgi:hypothetical protein
MQRLTDSVRAALAAALLWSWAAATARAGETLTLNCAGTLSSAAHDPAADASIAFQATVPFGEGRLIALTDPETGKIERLLYDAEAMTGSFQQAGGPAETIVWTRSTGRKAAFVGALIRSDGEIVSLSVESAPAAAGRRPFALFGTTGARLYRGGCD